MGNSTLTTDQVILLEASIPPEYANLRIDQVLARLFPEHSRSRLKQWLLEGAVLVNGKVLKPKEKVLGFETIKIEATLKPETDCLPESIPLDIVYEDNEILVINKPKGLVVHPAAGNQTGTLVNALLNAYPELIHIPRAGIVHRLDKDTTGLLIVAKTLEAHTSLVSQLQARTLKREYEAIVWGVIPSGATVKAPIARNEFDRKKMAVSNKGKEAITHYRVLKRFKAHSHLRVQLETGRTHQIRVHMAHIQSPIVGDKTYGGRLRVPKGASESLLQMLRLFPRQALHAKALSIQHPKTYENLSFEIPLPEDMQSLIEALSKEKS